MSDSIKVAIKVRPLIKREKEENLPIQWEVQGNHIYSIDPETKRRGDYSHVFDHIFDMKTNNADVYDVIVRPIVDAAVNGFNGTIFAYGQTSSGKTYTMMGTKDEPGVVPLAVENMFDAIANTSGREFLLRVSYLEIYNEKVNDLLHEDRTDLKIKEDPRNGQVYVECKEEVTNCPQNVLSIMKKGDKKRRIGETNMNERSSRSHTIFRITIESRASDSNNADGAVQVSQLNLVDLAGSERARQTGATGDRFKEGRHINLSLSSLGLVIMQLSESQEYVNFRDSKLTRILQTSLGGNAMTTIICAVTPAALDETQCTLAFASRAKSVKNKPQLNEVMSDEALLKRYSKQIAKLNAELEKSKQTSQCAKVEEMETKLQEKDRHIQLIEGRMELLKTRIVSGANSVENVDFKSKSRRRRTWGGPSIPGLLNHSSALPTIQETSATEITPAELKKAQIKRRQSIMQTPVNDIVNEKFQTAVEDFELELIESERNWEMGRLSIDSVDLEDNYHISKRKSGGNHVKFEDDVSVFQISYADSYAGSPEKSEPSTPPQRPEEQDSGTPKEVLRERISHLIHEYTALQEFTTLEKQLYATERVDNKDPDDMEAIVNHMKKSVTDSEMMCIETNKKYSDLQDKYAELELKYDATLQDHEVLRKQVEKLSGIEASLKLVELEKNQMKADMETKLRRLKKLEEERNDYEFQIELLESKHKTRQKELETSLQIAWTDYTDTGDKEKFSNILHLQSLVDKLTKEVEVLRIISEDSKQPLDNQLVTENKSMIEKVEEYDALLQSSKNENIKLMEELKALRKRLDYKPDLDRSIEVGENGIPQNKSTSIISKLSEEVIQDDINNRQPTALSKFHGKLNENETEETTARNNITANGSNDSELKTEPSTVEIQTFKEEESPFKELTIPILNLEPCETDNALLSNVQSDSDQFSLEELQKQINEKSATILELQNLLRLASEDNNNVKSEFESFKVKYEEQQVQINTLEVRVAELLDIELKVTNECKDLASKLNAVTLDKEAVTDENSKLKLKISQNSDQLKNNQSLIDSLKIDMDELKLKLEEKNSEVLSMKAKFEELQEIRTKVESHLEEPTTDKNSLRISSLEKELVANNNEIEKYKLEMISLNETILKKSDEIQMLNRMVNELNTKNEHFQSRFDSLHKELDKKTAIIVDLHNRTETILPDPDTTQNFIQSSTENSYTVRIESSNKTLSLSLTNLGTENTENCLENTLSRAVNNGDDQSITVNNDLLDSSAQIEEIQKSLIIDTEKESIDELKIELERLTVENANLLEENALLKSRTEMLLAQIEGVKIGKDLVEDLRAEESSLETELAERETKLRELQNDIHKLKDQIISMQSERTLYEGEKCAMQKILNENKVVIQQVPKLEANIQDLELMNAELERTILELRTSLNTKCLELESISVHKYESEIQNLKSYLENLEHFNKKIQDENEDLKNQLHNQSLNLENDLDDLKQRIAEQEKVTNNLEEDKTNLTKRIAEISQGKFEQNVTNKPDLLCESECCKEKLSQDSKDCTSIFANTSYFDEMDVSIGPDSTLQESTVDVSFYGEEKQTSDINMLRKRILELESMNKEFLSKLTTGEDDVSNNEIINRLHELMNVKTLLEDENSRITTELQLKIQESDEIKNDVQGLRLGIEKLQQTIHLLTTENMEMSSKLTVEKDRAKEAEAAYQGQVEDLYQRISKITQEKVNVESELRLCQEQLHTLRANTPTGTEDEVREKIERYQEKIDSLTTENIELSTNLIDKIEELDKVKESKALLYEHECSYKDQVQEFKEKVEELNLENIELSNSLIEKIEESDSLKHAYELLENKLAVSVKNQLSTSVNTTKNEIVELKAQNSQLKSENIELKAKVATLSIENNKFSDNLLETMAALDDSRLCHDQASVSDRLLDKSHYPSRNSDQFSAPEESPVTDDVVQTMKNKLEGYELQINHLTRLNKKLSELKLSSCPQCIHLKELNDSRRTLKLEVRSLNYKLEDLQKKFNQKCADTEVLRNKASEEMNVSVMSDMMLNGSLSESMNVSFVEEKVQSLNNELATLKQSHEKLSSLYRNKCSEVEKLNENNLMDESLAEVEPELPAPRDSKARIERVQGDVDKLREEIKNLKRRNAVHSESLQKFMNDKIRLQTEIDTLKLSKDDLNTKLKNSEMQIEVANEKVGILESEVTDLNKLVESLRIIEREAKSEKLNFEVEIELLKSEKITHHKALEELKTALKSEMANNATLQKNLETLIKEAEELKGTRDLVPETRKAQSQDYFEEHSNVFIKIEEPDAAGHVADLEEARNSIKELKHNSAELSEQNISLLGQIEAMRQSSVISEKELSSDHSNLKNEIETAKEYITKEIKSLKPGLELSNLSNKTVEELLIDFLKIIMMKEQEIVKAIQDRFEREKQSLEDAKRQSVNAERRVTTWAKELETDIEKLQADLSHHEKQNTKLKREIERLENDLKESEYEKQLLKEKIEVLESDFNGLQAELSKQSDVDNKQGKEVNAMQERERLALASAKNREIELQNNIKSLKDEHNKKVGELTFALEYHKTKNLELKSNFEGLEANEKQLKSIIDMKSMDLAKLQQRTLALEAENLQMSETCNHLNQENQNKIQHIEEITNLLKIKCDKLSEYKTNLESIIPEYEILKEQIKERKQYAERYKNEYEGFRGTAEKELNLIKDKLSHEEIKTSSLNEQLMDLNNKNKGLLSELQEMKVKCEELEIANDKLVKKVRNSTSNSRVEAQIEDLKDQNAMLKKNAEGASNRIIELQESKNLVTRDLISLQGKYEMLVEEKRELEKIIESNKVQVNSSNLQLKGLCEKLEAQIQEKNRIALELEATKLSVSRKEKEVITAQQEIERLRHENKELNEESEELAKEIQDRMIMIENLRIELYERNNDSEQISNNSGADNQRMKLIKDTTEIEILIAQNKELYEKVETTSKMVDFLRKENSEMKIKVTELEVKLESRSRGSSRSSSPLLENNRRKQRRSDLYNQSRPLDETSLSSILPADCRCSLLSQKVRELELEIVSKNGKIATLEMQIQSENFPYQKKCKELEENLWAFKNKNMMLKEDIKRLQRAISSTSVSECEVCRRRQTNKRDQSTQCLLDNKIFLCGTSSGVVDDFAKINKLEKEKALMRDLCRSRTRQINELQQQITEYAALLSEKSRMEATALIEDSKKNISDDNIRSSTLRDKTQIFGENNKRAMKENLSSNILDNASVISSNRTRSIWNQYP